MENKKLPFLETIYHLRTIEQIILYDKVMKISAQEEKETMELLQDEYEKEALDYPFQAPDFDKDSAFWASKIVYFSAQFLLNRENTAKDFNDFIPEFKGELSASAFLSADLCLRFLPQILEELKKIDADDIIIPVLEKHLLTFHYSAIGFDHEVESLDFRFFKNECFKQLYLNRITDRKDTKLARIPELNTMLLENFGDYQQVFWKNFEIINEKNKKI